MITMLIGAVLFEFTLAGLIMNGSKCHAFFVNLFFDYKRAANFKYILNALALFQIRGVYRKKNVRIFQTQCILQVFSRSVHERPF